MNFCGFEQKKGHQGKWENFLLNFNNLFKKIRNFQILLTKSIILSIIFVEFQAKIAKNFWGVSKNFDVHGRVKKPLNTLLAHVWPVYLWFSFHSFFFFQPFEFLPPYFDFINREISISSRC